jgi:hypothetical protein
MSTGVELILRGKEKVEKTVPVFVSIRNSAQTSCKYHANSTSPDKVSIDVENLDYNKRRYYRNSSCRYHLAKNQARATHYCAGYNYSCPMVRDMGSNVLLLSGETKTLPEFLKEGPFDLSYIPNDIK